MGNGVHKALPFADMHFPDMLIYDGVSDGHANSKDDRRGLPRADIVDTERCLVVQAFGSTANSRVDERGVDNMRK